MVLLPSTTTSNKTYCINNVPEVRSTFKVGSSLLHNVIMMRQSDDAWITKNMSHLRSPTQQSKGVVLSENAAVQSDCPYSLDPRCCSPV
jgi:hypothetical protein